MSWNLEAETGKLRVVYFDANENSDLTISGEEFPAELFTIGFQADSVTGGSKLDIAISGMSVKLRSDSSDETAMIVVNTDTAKGTVSMVVGISFSTVCLYEGDGVDLIPADKKAVAVAVTGIRNGTKLNYKGGTLGDVVIRPDELPEETIPETSEPEVTEPTEQADDYLSAVKDSDDQVCSGGKDKYQTDPIPW